MKMKKILILTLVWGLLIGLAGCNSAVKKENAPVAENKSQTQEKEAVKEKADQKKDENQAKVDEKKDENQLQADEEMVIIDMAGREVRLPKKDNRKALTDSPTTRDYILISMA